MGSAATADSNSLDPSSNPALRSEISQQRAASVLSTAPSLAMRVDSIATIVWLEARIYRRLKALAKAVAGKAVARHSCCTAQLLHGTAVARHSKSFARQGCCTAKPVGQLLTREPGHSSHRWDAHQWSWFATLEFGPMLRRSPRHGALFFVAFAGLTLE